jgi:NADH:ubiquinone reductase (H+-translocating)
VTDPAKIVVIGSGFAGLWAGLGAARRVDELAVPAGFVGITVVSRNPFHDVQVRNYEADLNGCRIPLSDVLDPAGISHLVADIKSIETDARTVITSTGTRHRYDRLVLASGSHVVVPDLPGMRESAFDVDTYDHEMALEQHLRALAHGPSMQAATTAVVVGAGLTGIETACELPGRFRSTLGECARVVLIDQNPWIGSNMGIAGSGDSGRLSARDRSCRGLCRPVMSPPHRWTTITYPGYPGRGARGIGSSSSPAYQCTA